VQNYNVAMVRSVKRIVNHRGRGVSNSERITASSAINRFAEANAGGTRQERGRGRKMRHRKSRTRSYHPPTTDQNNQEKTITGSRINRREPRRPSGSKINDHMQRITHERKTKRCAQREDKKNVRVHECSANARSCEDLQQENAERTVREENAQRKGIT